VVEALGRIESAAAVPALEEALSGEAEHLATAAAYALVQIGGNAAHDALLQAAGSDRLASRRAAAGVLGGIPDQRALGRLRVLLTDGDPILRLSAAENLARLGDTDSAAEMVRLLTDPDETVRTGPGAPAEGVVEAGGTKFSLLLLTEGTPPSPKVEGGRIVVGDQTVSLDGKRIVLGAFGE